MTTIINTPGGSNDGGSGAVLVVVVLILLAVGGYIFMVYGLPAMRSEQAPATTNIDISVPAVNDAMPEAAPQE